MKYLQVKQLLRINSEPLETLKEAQTILDSLESDLFNAGASQNESLLTLMCECNDAWTYLSNFLDRYEEYTKEN